EMLTAEQLLASGFLLKLVERDAMDAELAALCARAAENAPLTTRTTKETIRRMTFDELPQIEALIGQVYGSADFQRGVADFLAKTKRVPDWQGR
ncbi:MAG TPA: enoyl-CoA hydratase, partial [Sphingomonas sp.]|nr:enoyl-CoA hydratase [Sphingomonas sp.]